ncbi:MAG: 3-oxoadipate enol-lactonase [Bradyrhizobium sp.]|nr:3-oxoadipate enol-lactonase [Bradyrhizobium sp.]
MPTTADGIHYVTNDLRPPWVTSGLPVIFHHGIGTNLDIWAEWVPVIAARHPMVRFDMRGFGRSAIPPEHHQWSMDEMVKDLWDVADTTGAGKFTWSVNPSAERSRWPRPWRVRNGSPR